MIPVARTLSSCRGIGPCGCPSSSSICLTGTSSFADMNPAPVSTSCVDDITASITFQTMWTTVFDGVDLESAWIGKIGLLLNNANPPARDLPFVLHRYGVLKCAHKHMLLDTYLTVAFGWVAA